VSYFFEGLEETDGGIDDGFAQRMTEFVSTPEGLELASLFPRLADRRLRRRVVDLVRAMVDDEAPLDPSSRLQGPAPASATRAFCCLDSCPTHRPDAPRTK
jgi:hypothetical protein